MRLIHNVHFSSQEIEFYRQLVFSNLTRGLEFLLDALEDMELQVAEDNQPLVTMIQQAPDLKDGEAFPKEYYEPLKKLWEDEHVQKGWARGNEAALPEKQVLSPS